MDIYPRKWRVSSTVRWKFQGSIFLLLFLLPFISTSLFDVALYVQVLASQPGMINIRLGCLGHIRIWVVRPGV